MLLSESLNDDDVQKKGRAWVLTRQVDSRIEPLLVSKKRFQSDEGSPILEIVRKEGLELRIWNNPDGDKNKQILIQTLPQIHFFPRKSVSKYIYSFEKV